MEGVGSARSISPLFVLQRLRQRPAAESSPSQCRSGRRNQLGILRAETGRRSWNNLQSLPGPCGTDERCTRPSAAAKWFRSAWPRSEPMRFRETPRVAKAGRHGVQAGRHPGQKDGISGAGASTAAGALARSSTTHIDPGVRIGETASFKLAEVRPIAHVAAIPVRPSAVTWKISSRWSVSSPWRLRRETGETPRLDTTAFARQVAGHAGVAGRRKAHLSAGPAQRADVWQMPLAAAAGVQCLIDDRNAAGQAAWTSGLISSARRSVFLYVQGRRCHRITLSRDSWPARSGSPEATPIAHDQPNSFRSLMAPALTFIAIPVTMVVRLFRLPPPSPSLHHGGSIRLYATGDPSRSHLLRAC